MLRKFKGWIASEMVSLLLVPSLCAVPLSRLSKGCFALWISIVLNNLKIENLYCCSSVPHWRPNLQSCPMAAGNKEVSDLWQ